MFFSAPFSSNQEDIFHLKHHQTHQVLQPLHFDIQIINVIKLNTHRSDHLPGLIFIIGLTARPLPLQILISQLLEGLRDRNRDDL